MKRRLFAYLACLVLCLGVAAVPASADSGPKPALTVTVVNPPEGEYYLDLLIRESDRYESIDPAEYDPVLIQGLKSWEEEGWYPALVEGTSRPLFGDLRAGEDGVHRFSYYGLPDTFRIAVSAAEGAKATEESFTRTVFYTHLTYDWASNTITRATTPVGFYTVQFASTLVPTLIVEGLLLWLFGFRARRDWLVFFLVNVLTQVWLHLWAGSGIMAAGGHYLWYLMLSLAEIPILVVELIAYLFLLKEHGKGRRALYAVCANAASYAAGYLPLHWAVRFLAG